MTRQSISLSEPNNEWLIKHIEEVKEYSNKSELINDLIRKARRAEAINTLLKASEKSGYVSQNADEILAEFKSKLNKG